MPCPNIRQMHAFWHSNDMQYSKFCVVDFWPVQTLGRVRSVQTYSYYTPHLFLKAVC